MHTCPGGRRGPPANPEAAIGNEWGLELYLQEINRIPLLTAEQEVELGTAVQAGDMEARGAMVRANLRLVVSIAKHFVDRGLTLSDLIEEGNIGLMKAAERFDPEQGCRFSTYATWWIKQSIRRALIDTTRLVRIPSYMAEMVTRWRRTAAQLGASLGRTPDFQEVVEHMPEQPPNTRLLKAAVRVSSSTRNSVSLHGRAGLTELIEDKDQGRPEAAMVMDDQKRSIARVLQNLPERNATIIRLRYGLGDPEAVPMTLQQIGDRIGLSRERVRQIEAESLRLLSSLLSPEDS